eukprot:5604326-Amphidinium_carterae.1
MRYAGVSYKKVCSLLRELDDQVISGASVQHLKGIGSDMLVVHSASPENPSFSGKRKRWNR